MNVKDKYFRLQGKALNIQYEIRELNNQIRILRKKQRKIHEKAAIYDAEVRQMFNDGVFNHYGNEIQKWADRLINNEQ